MDINNTRFFADYPKPFISLSLDDVTGSTDISGNSLTVADSNVSLTNFDQFPKKAFYFSNNSSTVTITSTALITRLAIYGPWAAFAHVTCITGPCTVFQLRNASNSVKWQLTMFQSGQNNAHTITAFCPGASIIGTANVSLRLVSCFPPFCAHAHHFPIL